MSGRSRTSRVSPDNPTQPTTGGPERTYSDAEIEAALVNGHGILAQAARILGCARKTIQDRVEARPDYWRPILGQLRATIVDRAENVIVENLERGDLQTAIYVTKTIGKDRGWSERHEVTGADGGDLVITIRPPKRDDG